MDKPLIMVVDDEKVVADSISRTIGADGKYEVITVYSAKDALDKVRKNRILWGLYGNKIRVIVLDIKMPDIDGLQFLETLRKKYGQEIAVIMLTAWEDAEKWDRATSGFVINYIKKPYRREELLGTLDRFFKGKEGELVLETMDRAILKEEEFKKSA